MFSHDRLIILNKAAATYMIQYDSVITNLTNLVEGLNGGGLLELGHDAHLIPGQLPKLHHVCGLLHERKSHPVHEPI